MPFAHQHSSRRPLSNKGASTSVGRRIFLLCTVLLLGAWGGATGLHLHYGLAVDVLAGMLIAFTLLLISLLFSALLRSLARHCYRVLGLTGIAAIFTLTFLAFSIAMPPLLALPLAMVAILLIVCLALGLHQFQQRPLRALAILLVPLITLSLSIFWILLDSPIKDPVKSLIEPAELSGEPYRHLLLKGPYSVDRLSYGSGRDLRRKAFAADVSWQSSSVDGRRLLHSPKGLGISLRERWWGFGLNALPLNGRVWYPNKEGKLPIVMLAHGNHDMMQWSDTGYEWLAEHLASHGYLVISVDQNFLNSGILGALHNENNARAWLLLEHLRAWRAWRNKPTHALHKKADLNRVVLIGHSRGGEAVALAALFNTLSHYPDDGLQVFDYGFGIKGIATLAGFTGVSGPSDKLIQTKGVNFFALHGGYDTDVFAFAAERQYLRSHFDKHLRGFRASLYVHHANHGQFNTHWGSDTNGPMLHLLNQKALISGEQQRQIALLYLSAFIEASVSNNQSMPDFFCDAEKVSALLAPTLYVSRCDHSARRVLAGFGEDVDLRTTAFDNLSLKGQDLTLWREKDIGLRAGHKRLQTGLWIGWEANANKQPALHLTFAAPQAFEPDAVLWLDIAQADQTAPGALPAIVTAENLRSPLDLQIVIEDANGLQHRETLANFHRLLPPLPAMPYRLSLINSLRFQHNTEPLLQSVAIPLKLFAEKGIDVSAVKKISLNANPETNAVLIIGRITVDNGKIALSTP